MKKIVIYLTGMDRSGGKERVVANLLNQWVETYEILLITKNSKKHFYKIPEKVKIITLDVPFTESMLNQKANRLKRAILMLFNLIMSIIMLKKVLKKEQYNYLYVTTPLNSFEAFFAMREAKNKLVVSEHAYAYGYNKIYSFMKRKIYPKAYCVSVPNKMDTDIYKEWGCNAIYIPHLLTYEALEKNKLDSKIILTVGRLTADKQHRKLIQIWSKIKNKNGWKLWIVGDGEEKKTLEQLVQELEVMDTVKLLPATKEIASIYNQASIFAFASRCEGFGMVLLEAMSFGVPCISFDCPSGPRDVIIDGENGVLVPNNNCELFQEKLEQLITVEEDELKKLGDQAFNTVKNWDNEKIISMWDNEIFKSNVN